MSEKLHRPSIEVNLTQHCNLSCANCDHSSHLLPSKFASLQQVHEDLGTLSRVLHARELQLVGGEPLLHPDLIRFLEAGIETGIADKITVVTNGLLLDKEPEAFWELVDYLWISIYPGVRYRVDLDDYQRVADKHNVWIWKKKSGEFGRSQLNTKNKSSRLAQLIYDRCMDAHIYSCHTIHEGRYYKCPQSSIMATRLQQLGISYQEGKVDSVRIHDNPRLREDLESYISSGTPLQACWYCLGTMGRPEPHYQMNKRQIEAALSEREGDLRDLLNPDYLVPAEYFDPDPEGE